MKKEYKIENILFPAQPDIPTTNKEINIEFQPPDSAVYKNANPYPAEISKIIGHNWFDGDKHILTIAIYPVQYYHNENKIVLHTDIKYEIEYSSGAKGIVTQKSRSAKHSSFYRNILKNMVINPDDMQGILDGGAIYRIYMPDEWNEDLVLFAHGYVAVTEPVAIPESHLILPDGTSIPELINSMGYAFATTSYRANGMAVQEALIDMVLLAWKFEELYGEPEHNFLVGASEGGLVTTKSLEMKRLYHGGLAVCGPVGDFLTQVNYMGDFRVLFDYYFPGILPGDPMNIPQEVMDNWDTVYLPKIVAAISADPEKTLELLRVAKAPFDPADPETAGQTVAGILWYNVFATNDLVSRVGGDPFDNMSRRYHGSSNDIVLNTGVQRIQGEQDAIANLKAMFDTYGTPREPLITMHTAGDPIVPFWHERLYRQKVNANGSPGLYHNIPVMRYGHCNFTTEEVLTGFALLILQVTGKEMFDPPNLDKRSLVSAQETWYKIICLHLRINWNKHLPGFENLEGVLH